MNVLKFKKGDIVAKKQDKVTEWYLIQEGTVVRSYQLSEVAMGSNAIVGILESGWFACDYVAAEDTTVIVIPCKNAADLQNILSNHDKFRPIFLRTALEQRHQMLGLYAKLYQKAGLLHNAAENIYNDYCNLCEEYLITPQTFEKIEQFEAISLTHKAENWEIANSSALLRNNLRAYMQLMISDNDLCVGSIMEASAQMRRVSQGIVEITNYLRYNRDILWSDSENDICHLYMNLATELSKRSKDIKPCQDKLLSILGLMKSLDIFDSLQLKECETACHSGSFNTASEERINIAKEDCVARILTYAGYEKTEIRAFKELLNAYKALPDMASTDNDARRLRKEITKVFYDAYEKCMVKLMLSGDKPTHLLLMFFNFGFMDVELLGEDNTIALYNLMDSLELFSSNHVYTMYRWLSSVYAGANEPSKNEFDQDYPAYLNERLKHAEITEAERDVLKSNQVEKLKYEIRSMFKSAHRITYGRISTFCPIIAADDVINTFEKMAITVERLENAVNKIRQIDYSVLYREVIFSDPAHGINQEVIMKEVMPNFILTPCIGIRAQMWQETAGPRNDTSARLLFPVFLTSDLDEQLAETFARFRWELCRKIQGVYWNDFRERSLTSEYYDYIQFYKKNRDLSPDAKEKIKNALARSRNNFREVFVKDYVNWLKYESQGSFRLNKVARNILITYCPFSVDIRTELITNPLYQVPFTKLEIENQKKANRFKALMAKYEEAGGVVTQDLKQNLKFYEL